MTTCASGPGSTCTRGATRARCVWRAALLAIGIVVVVLMPASGAVSATSGLVAAYGFEEGSGATAADSSGNGNDGTIANATWTSSGAYGSALHLDGSGPGVLVPDSPSLHLRHAMTLEAWVKPAAISAAWRDVVYKGDDNYYLEATSPMSGLPAGGVSVNGGGHTETFGTTALSTARWTHLALTYDGSALRLYIDGNEVSSVSETSSLRSSTNPLEIGGDGIYGQYFEGLIDEVRVYDIARTPDEIRLDMSTPVVPGTPGDPQPPSAPGTLSASAASSSEVDLSWGAASDNVGVAGYELFRCLGDGCTDFTPLAHVDGTTTSYQDTTVTASSSYSYQVRAVDAAGNTGDFSNTASAQTPANADTQPPSAPTGLGVSSAGQTSLALVWDASSDNVGVAGYGVYSNGSLVASPTATGYTLTGLLCGDLVHGRGRRLRRSQQPFGQDHDHDQHRRLSRHAAAVGAGDAVGVGGEFERGRFELGRGQRQRGGGRVRAVPLPGRWLHRLHPARAR